MYLKVIAPGAVTLFGSLYLSAMPAHDDYSRDVGRPLPIVYAALADIRSSDLPGVSADFRTAPQLQLKPEGTDALTWQVVRGNEVAMTFSVAFTPIGKSTRVQANLAMQDVVDPAHALPIGQTEAVMKRAFAAAFDAKIAQIESAGGK